MKPAALLPLALLALASPALAGDAAPRAVLELFTSEGCSSCPPADAMLDTLATRPDVIALAYHVDYWDYIGWADTFGAKANTERQHAYAAAWHTAQIYTPELVVNGRASVVGSDKSAIDGALDMAKLDLPVIIKPDADGMLDVDVAGRPGAHQSGVWLVTFIDKANVNVERGENAGHTISYSRVVTGRHILGMWDPNTGAHLKLPLDEILVAPSNGLAILVQSEHGGLPGPIMGAAAYIH
jgi:hypothetical protein